MNILYDFRRQCSVLAIKRSISLFSWRRDVSLTLISFMSQSDIRGSQPGPGTLIFQIFMKVGSWGTFRLWRRPLQFRAPQSKTFLVIVKNICCHRPLLCGGGWVAGRTTWRPGRPARPRGAWGEVWPGSGRRSPPCDWPLVSLAAGHRRGDLGTAHRASGSLVVCLVRCGGSLWSVEKENNIFRKEVKWCEVRWRKWREVEWKTRKWRGDWAIEALPARAGDTNPSQHPDRNNSQPHLDVWGRRLRYLAIELSGLNSSPASRYRVVGVEAYLKQGTTSRLRLPSPSKHRSIGRSVGYWQPRHRGADIRQRLSSSSPSLLSPHILLLPFLSGNTTQECRWRVNQRTTRRQHSLDFM